LKTAIVFDGTEGVTGRGHSLRLPLLSAVRGGNPTTERLIQFRWLAKACRGAPSVVLRKGNLLQTHVSSPRSWPNTNAAGAPSYNSTGIELSEPNQRIAVRWESYEDAQLTAGWLAGHTLQAIADGLGRNPKSTSQRRQQIGLAPRVAFTKWTPELDAILRQLLAEREPFSTISKRLGVTRNSAIGRANRLGISSPNGTTNNNYRVCRLKKRGPPKWPAERNAILTAMWHDLIPAEEIGKALGCAPKTAINQAAKLGLRRTVTRRVPSGLYRTSPGRSAIPSSADRLGLPDPAHADCLTLAELKHGSCHWPLGEPTKFCGRKASEIGHGSYCEQHYARSINRRIYA
jgi:hypothetical protein